MTHSDKDKPRQLTRREFLRGALLSLGVGGLTACGVDVREVANPWQTPSAYRVLQSPMPPESEATSVASTELAQFLAVSSALTGFDNLNPQLGQVYLDALNQHADLDMDFATFVDESEFSDIPTLDDIEAAGVFDDEARNSVAQTILTYWYTGIHATEEGEVVATYVDTLAWKSVSNIKPRTICGAPGFWAQDPTAAN